jgi:hypothetical protein
MIHSEHSNGPVAGADGAWKKPIIFFILSSSEKLKTGERDPWYLSCILHNSAYRFLQKSCGGG